jgi:hypothetical protein
MPMGEPGPRATACRPGIGYNLGMFRLALHWQIAIGMVAGAAIGVVLNAMAGTATTSFSSDLPTGLTSVTISDTVGRMVIETVDATGRGERIEIGHAADADDGLRNSPGWRRGPASPRPISGGAASNASATSSCGC